MNRPTATKSALTILNKFGQAGPKRDSPQIAHRRKNLRRILKLRKKPVFLQNLNRNLNIQTTTVTPITDSTPVPHALNNNYKDLVSGEENTASDVRKVTHTPEFTTKNPLLVPTTTEADEIITKNKYIHNIKFRKKPAFLQNFNRKLNIQSTTGSPKVHSPPVLKVTKDKMSEKIMNLDVGEDIKNSSSERMTKIPQSGLSANKASEIVTDKKPLLSLPKAGETSSNGNLKEKDGGVAKQFLSFNREINKSVIVKAPNHFVSRNQVIVESEVPQNDSKVAKVKPEMESATQTPEVVVEKSVTTLKDDLVPVVTEAQTLPPTTSTAVTEPTTETPSTESPTRYNH